MEQYPALNPSAVKTVVCSAQKRLEAEFEKTNTSNSAPATSRIPAGLRRKSGRDPAGHGVRCLRSDNPLLLTTPCTTVAGSRMTNIVPVASGSKAHASYCLAIALIHGATSHPGTRFNCCATSTRYLRCWMESRNPTSVWPVFETSFNMLRQSKRMSTDYFDVRYFKGMGTIHFYPRNVKLIDRLNRAGRPPSSMAVTRGESVPEWDSGCNMTRQSSWIKRFGPKSPATLVRLARSFLAAQSRPDGRRKQRC